MDNCREQIFRAGPVFRTVQYSVTNFLLRLYIRNFQKFSPLVSYVKVSGAQFFVLEYCQISASLLPTKKYPFFNAYTTAFFVREQKM